MKEIQKTRCPQIPVRFDAPYKATETPYAKILSEHKFAARASFDVRVAIVICCS